MEKIKQTFTAEVKKSLVDTKAEKSCCKKAYNYGHAIFKEQNFTYIDRSFFKCASCPSHFLRGVFVSTGSVNAPDKGHHLEMKTAGKPEADELAIILMEIGFEAKISCRRSNSIVYFKDGDTIFGFLSFIGAQKCAFDFLEAIIEKQVRNDCNRKTNFDTANLQKTASASKKQLEAINYFYDTGKVNLLSDVLRVTAELKHDNPSASLNELASLHNPEITKSCANHRLAKIIEHYEAITGKKQG